MSPRAPMTADGASHLAWLRTRFAVERTFMAWVRTAAAMIGFGFSIVEFFSRFSTIEEVERARSHYVPFVLGVILVGTGVVSLAIAFAQHLRALRHLDGEEFADVSDHRSSTTPSWVVAIALEVAGIVALGSIILRAIL